MLGTRLVGRHIVIVGASAGIGAATAQAACAEGATVIGGARRFPDAGPGGNGFVGVNLDLTDPTSIEAFAATVRNRVGTVHALLVTAGITHLAPLADTDAATLGAVIATNAVGVHELLRQCRGLLRRSDARVGICSSDAVAHPFPGLGAYVASKAALDVLVDVWQQEQPDLALTRIVIGPTMTQMAAHWDPQLLADYLERWQRLGRFEGVTPVEPEVVAGALVDWLAADEVPSELDLYTRLNKR